MVFSIHQGSSKGSEQYHCSTASRRYTKNDLLGQEIRFEASKSIKESFFGTKARGKRNLFISFHLFNLLNLIDADNHRQEEKQFKSFQLEEKPDLQRISCGMVIDTQSLFSKQNLLFPKEGSNQSSLLCCLTRIRIWSA